MHNFSSILAVDENNLIGDDGKMPWHIPNDFKHFKEITTGKTVVMGRKTFESIGRPLPNRVNIVISRDPDYSPKGVITFHSLSEFYKYVKYMENSSELFIIGGANLINQLYDDISTFYITHIDKAFNGDCHIEIDFRSLNMIHEEYIEPDEINDFGYSFVTYKK